ncbi:MAG TPA: thiolase family protein [Trebonia sp.]|nr:thiolase family protein [Trebonia sp.]
MSTAAIVGAGLTPFGRFKGQSLSELAGQAIAAALADAEMEPGEIQAAFVANSMASVTTGQVAIVGQAVLRPLGYSAIPVYNIDNACAASSSALDLAVQAVESGRAEVVLVAGVEKLFGAARSDSYRALNGAVDTGFLAAAGVDAASESVFVASIYPERLGRYRSRYGLEARVLAEIAVKNRAHAALNPNAQYTEPISVADVLGSRVVAGPLTALMCAPVSDGASAVVVTSAGRARSAGLRPVLIRGIATGMGAPPGEETAIARIARRAFAEAGITPADVDVAEVHDSIAFNELLAYEELGLCEAGEGARFAASGATGLSGTVPVNTSGGLESRGHPVAATGLAQIIELVAQIRHEAGERQVAGARIAVAENAGGFAVDDTAAIVVTVLGADPP